VLLSCRAYARAPAEATAQRSWSEAQCLSWRDSHEDVMRRARELRERQHEAILREWDRG
jgi:hypothetical protein